MDLIVSVSEFSYLLCFTVPIVYASDSSKIKCELDKLESQKQLNYNFS